MECYKCYSCFPESSFLKGSLLLDTNVEDFKGLKIAGLLSGSLFYPVTVCVVAVAQTFFCILALIHSVKASWHLKAITKIISQQMVERRVAKLDRRITQQQPHVMKEGKNLANLEEEFEQTRASPATWDRAKKLIELKKRLKPIILYLRWTKEKSAYKNLGVEQVFKIRHEFAVVRHRLSSCIKWHYILTLFKILIPFCGFYLAATSPYTTDVFLEKQHPELIKRYNELISKYSWLKPY
jgi:hypothetical protein